MQKVIFYSYHKTLGISICLETRLLQDFQVCGFKFSDTGSHPTRRDLSTKGVKCHHLRWKQDNVLFNFEYCKNAENAAI